MGTRNSVGNTYFQLQNLPMIHIPFFLILIFCQLTGAITNGQPPLYNPTDNIAIDCGSSGSNTVEGNRTWKGDIDSVELFSSEGQNNASNNSKVVGTFTVASVPYKTARLSRTSFTYTVPVSTHGPKFIRFHFYADRYENSELSDSNAFFSVEADTYTLLRNFSVFLTADALETQDIVKEFLVAIKSSDLNITFTPSSSISGAFAFVNGIEVVSVPNNLYYSESERPDLIFVGQQSSYNFRNDTALGMMYRINIGGRAYPEDGNTGMFRNWEQDDYRYLTIVGDSVLASTNEHLNFISPSTPAYSAPEGVYQSALSMGRDKDKNIAYKLTWEFPVHPRFDYLVRLHFCEIGMLINSTNDRVFRILITDQTAEDRADVIYWSGNKYVPFFKDYIVPIYSNQLNLSVALQAYADRSISIYPDAILNGIEIFKLNDSNGNLAGPNPDPKSKTSPNASTSRSQGNGKNINRAVIIGIVSGLVVLSILGLLIFWRRRKVKDSATWWGHNSIATNNSSKTRGSSSLPSDLCRYFSLAEIKAATKNFEDTFIIGVGGFGNVYKGYIDDGTTPVAIKRLKPESSQGANEFKTEIEMLSHLRHRHLVSLIGYCNDDREMILVYDYMARGTLRHHLYDTDNSPLSWKERLEICIGAARGLQYLHTGAKHQIIHRDVKTTNILLDEKWVAKVSDFGLSKIGPTGGSKAHVSTMVKGSVGYLDPEYYKRQQLTEKSDVYSFGVVLCEVLCARPPILRTAGKGKVSLAEWVPNCYHEGTLNQIIDPHLTGKIAPECLKKYGEILVSCMLDNGTERPSMNEIVWGLEFAMQLQQSAEDNDRVGGAILNPKNEDEVPFVNDSDGPFSCSWEDTSESKSSGLAKFSSSERSTTNESIKGMSGAVFSEINTDPKGR